MMEAENNDQLQLFQCTSKTETIYNPILDRKTTVTGTSMYAWIKPMTVLNKQPLRWRKLSGTEIYLLKQRGGASGIHGIRSRISISIPLYQFSGQKSLRYSFRQRKTQGELPGISKFLLIPKAKQHLQPSMLQKCLRSWCKIAYRGYKL